MTIARSGSTGAGPAVSAGADRRSTPLGDTREHPVPCLLCGQPTWNIDAICDTGKPTTTRSTREGTDDDPA
jgi:hypothetical protein